MPFRRKKKKSLVGGVPLPAGLSPVAVPQLCDGLGAKDEIANADKAQDALPQMIKSKPRRHRKKSKQSIHDTGPGAKIVPCDEALSDSRTEAVAISPHVDEATSVPANFTVKSKRRNKNKRTRNRKKSTSSYVSSVTTSANSPDADAAHDHAIFVACSKPTCKDSIQEWTEEGLAFPQVFGNMCKSLITRDQWDHPPAPNAHIEFFDFIDEIEKQFRKEYQNLRLSTFKYFCTEFAIEPAFETKVRMLHGGVSESKLFIINSWWANGHVVPIRLVVQAERKYTQVRVHGKWQSLSALLEMLVMDNRSWQDCGQSTRYELLDKYWDAVRAKKKQAFKFFELPLELRRIIYRHLVQANDITVTISESMLLTRPGLESPGTLAPPPRLGSGALLRTNKQTRFEIIEELYQMVDFRFRSAAHLTKFAELDLPLAPSKVILSMTLEEHMDGVNKLKETPCNVFEQPCWAKLRKVIVHIGMADRNFHGGPGGDVYLNHQQFLSNHTSLYDPKVLEEVETQEEMRATLRSDYEKLTRPLKHCKIVMR